MPQKAQAKTEDASGFRIIARGHGIYLCLPQRAPLVRSLGAGQWELAADWSFVLGRALGGRFLGHRETATIPAGFVSDLFSVPPLLRAVLPRDQRDNRPAFIHDFLYATIGLRSHWIEAPVFSRAECDAALLLAMEATGFGWLRRHDIYAGVRLGGWLPWHKISLELCSVTKPMMGRTL